MNRLPRTTGLAIALALACAAGEAATRDRFEPIGY